MNSVICMRKSLLGVLGKIEVHYASEVRIMSHHTADTYKCSLAFVYHNAYT